MKYLFLKQTLLDTALELLRAAESVTHRRKANIKCQTHHELAMRNITAALDNILRLDLEGCRIVNLFEVSCEKALMVILPFDESGDLVSKLRIRYVATCFVHCALIAAFH